MGKPVSLMSVVYAVCPDFVFDLYSRPTKKLVSIFKGGFAFLEFFVENRLYFNRIICTFVRFLAIIPV